MSFWRGMSKNIFGSRLIDMGVKFRPSGRTDIVNIMQKVVFTMWLLDDSSVNIMNSKPAIVASVAYMLSSLTMEFLQSIFGLKNRNQ